MLSDLKLGDSVAVNGPCLTVVKIGRDSFQVEATSHTVKSSTIAKWSGGKQLNLERALMVGDRLGGHIVQGHVDGIGTIARISPAAGYTKIYVNLPSELQKLMAPKGSVTVDGISLTISEKTSMGIVLMVVPYSLKHTTLGLLKPGHEVNIESDLVIRWLADRLEKTDKDNFYSKFDIFHKED